MSSGKSYDYPSCEADDCYCQNHWPNRSGGEEFKAVNNNEEGDYMWLCPMGYEYHRWADGKCDACGKFMVYNSLDIYLSPELSKKLCVRCCYNDYSSDLIDYFNAKVLKDGKICEFHKIFNFTLSRVKDKSLVDDAVMCEECDMVHPPIPENCDLETTDAFYFFDSSGEFVTFDGSQECLNRMSELLEEYEDNYIALRDVMIGFIEYKKERIEEKRTAKKNKTKNIRAIAHQVISKYVGASIEDIKGNGFISRLLAKQSGLLHLETLERLLAKQKPIEFVLWLTQNTAFE